MRMSVLALMLLLSSGAAPELEARFTRLQNDHNAKWLQVTGVQIGCLVVASEDFKLRLKEDPLLAKYGTSIDDFDAIVIEKDGRCIVAFNARGKKTGGGMEYWIEGRQVMKKGYAK